VNAYDQKLLNAFFADHFAEAADVRRITGHAGFVIGLTTEELPWHRFRPARTKGLVTLIEGML